MRPLYGLLILAVLSLSGCGSQLPGITLTGAPDGSKVIVVTDSPGGDVRAFANEFKRWSRSEGAQVEIRHRCASACTQVFDYFVPDEICLARGSTVVFHSVTTDQLDQIAVGGAINASRIPSEIDPIGTMIMFAMYPSWIQSRLSTAGVMGLGRNNTAATIDAAEFWSHGYRMCSGQSARQGNPLVTQSKAGRTGQVLRTNPA